MRRYHTEQQVRQILSLKKKQMTQRALAKEIGISEPLLSQMLNGTPLTGKVLAFLGFKRARVFESMEAE